MSLDPTSPQAALPHISHCQGEFSGFGDYVDCLTPNPSLCKHVLSFAAGYLCLHPDRFEIASQNPTVLRP